MGLIERLWPKADSQRSNFYDTSDYEYHGVPPVVQGSKHEMIEGEVQRLLEKHNIPLEKALRHLSVYDVYSLKETDIPQLQAFFDRQDETSYGTQPASRVFGFHAHHLLHEMADQGLEICPKDQEKYLEWHASVCLQTVQHYLNQSMSESEKE